MRVAVVCRWEDGSRLVRPLDLESLLGLWGRGDGSNPVDEESLPGSWQDAEDFPTLFLLRADGAVEFTLCVSGPGEHPVELGYDKSSPWMSGEPPWGKSPAQKGSVRSRMWGLFRVLGEVATPTTWLSESLSPPIRPGPRAELSPCDASPWASREYNTVDLELLLGDLREASDDHLFGRRTRGGDSRASHVLRVAEKSFPLLGRFSLGERPGSVVVGENFRIDRGPPVSRGHLDVRSLVVTSLVSGDPPGESEDSLWDAMVAAGVAVLDCEQARARAEAVAVLPSVDDATSLRLLLGSCPPVLSAPAADLEAEDG